VKQEIRFCRAPDGVRIAYAVHGSGPLLVIGTCWLSHLQFDWESPVWRHFLADIGRFATIVRYDERGHGLSDWDVEDFGFEARIGDLEAVIDHAGLDRFALMGMAQGGPVAIAYAARHPERVSRLIFYGSFAGWRREPTAEERELSEAYDAMIRVGWARPDSAFRRVFTSLMIPDATEEQMRWLDDLQRVSVSASNASAFRNVRTTTTAVDLLPELDVPTLVLHARGDRMQGFEEGRFLASEIRGARLVALESDNHIILESEPAWPILVDEVRGFLEPDRRSSASGTERGDDLASLLSERELEVLGLAAQGLDNDAIAERLVLSIRTVERHLQNVYAKLGVSGRSARTAAVARLFSTANA
jgi:pimeloyl-ACP methyl ester carboxylesterase/DNA-binding CsgD family transcriptional regulator